MSTDNADQQDQTQENVVTAIEVASGDNVEITVVQKEKVAQGGWATVYRAEISPGKETIAIKQVKETKLYKHREMEILRSMKPHENIVRLHYYAEQADVTDHDTRLLTLFMDYLPSNLHTLIQDHTPGIPLELIRVYSRQLLSGLAHLASQNIVHRDLVPRNILIDPERKILKIADFGCAKVVNPELPNHPHVGVWQYRGVELLFGATRYSSQADIWSAGVVILEMMSGKFPFTATSEEVMLASILTILGPITMEQVRDMGVDPMLFPELLMGSTFHARRWSDVQVFPQTPSVELRSMLNLMLEYSPRRRKNAAKLLDHEFFKGDN